MNPLVYLDTETTGLDPTIHDIWEIAYAVDDGPIHSAIVRHSLTFADPTALAVSRYYDRTGGGDPPTATTRWFELTLRDLLDGATLVGANPAFDAAMLYARWGQAPWHFRLLDIEAYAMGTLGYDLPRGLATITRDLRARGYDIPEPDHSAAADVAATRACHLALVDLYRRLGVTPMAEPTICDSCGRPIRETGECSCSD